MAPAPGGGEGVGALGQGPAGGGRTCTSICFRAPSHGLGTLPAGNAVAARPAALGTPPLRRCRGIQGADRGGAAERSPSKIGCVAPGPPEGRGPGPEVISLAPRQAGGEGAQSKVIAPGFAPHGAAGAAAAVNMFVRQPRPSSP